jgi:hypothetical protein
VVQAGALPVPYSLHNNHMGLNRQTSSAKAGFTAGQSSFTAAPGRQHNCFPSALGCTHTAELFLFKIPFKTDI